MRGRRWSEIRDFRDIRSYIGTTVENHNYSDEYREKYIKKLEEEVENLKAANAKLRSTIKFFKGDDTIELHLNSIFPQKDPLEIETTENEEHKQF